MVNIFNSRVHIYEMKLQSPTNEVDLSHVFRTINIFEDVFEHFISCQLAVVDTNDLMQNFPLYAGIRLHFVYSLEESSDIRSMQFILYKIEEDASIVKERRRNRGYGLYFVSPEYMLNISSILNRKFAGCPKKIITDISDEVLNVRKFESEVEPQRNIELWANFWTPTKVIGVCNQLLTNQTQIPLYYQTIEGQRHVDLNKKLQEEPKFNLELMNNFGDFRKEEKMKFFKFVDYVDYIESVDFDINGQTVISPNKNTYGFKKFSHDNISKFITNLGKKSILPKEFNNKSSHSVDFLEYPFGNIRNSLLYTLKRNNIVVQLFPDITKKLLDTVNVFFPNIDNNTQLHKLFDGTWIITKIRHIISNDLSYVQNVQLAKNAYLWHRELEDVKGKVNSSKSVKK